MKITVVGAGAIGGYLGARLSAAGEEVTFIARNRNLEAINAHGFRLIHEDGSELHAPAVRAVQRYADAVPQDAVLLTVKAHQVRDLLPEEADDLLTRRFAIVQVWRAIRNPIESHPLGIVDHLVHRQQTDVGRA